MPLFEMTVKIFHCLQFPLKYTAGMTVKFNTTDQPEFFQTLVQRVNAYFRENNIPKHGGAKLALKATIMVLLFWGSYGAILTGILPTWGMFLAWAIMGFGMAGIGMCIMHDANHRAYCKSRRLNRLIGYISDLVGVSSANWQMKHNLLHHTFTNIHGVDEDIEAPEWLLRFDPHTPLYKIQRWQHWYAPAFYSFLTIPWTMWDDFIGFFRHRNNPAIKVKPRTFWADFSIMAGFKIFYYFSLLVLPMMLVPVPWWQSLLGFLLMHVVAGLILSHIFQLAHVVERVKIPNIPESGTMKNSWAIHQLKTTVNFAQNNAFLQWFAGGLTNQVEHHLFPSISHVHYPKIAEIVQQTAEEFQLPYFQNKTLWSALCSHYRLLKRLGREKQIDDLAFDH